MSQKTERRVVRRSCKLTNRPVTVHEKWILVFGGDNPAPFEEFCSESICEYHSECRQQKGSPASHCALVGGFADPFR